MRPSESYGDLMKVVKNWEKDSFYLDPNLIKSSSLDIFDEFNFTPYHFAWLKLQDIGGENLQKFTDEIKNIGYDLSNFLSDRFNRFFHNNNIRNSTISFKKTSPKDIIEFAIYLQNNSVDFDTIDFGGCDFGTVALELEQIFFALTQNSDVLYIDLSDIDGLTVDILNSLVKYLPNTSLEEIVISKENFKSSEYESFAKSVKDNKSDCSVISESKVTNMIEIPKPLDESVYDKITGKPDSCKDSRSFPFY
ncbi:MAG: hypothetical protein ISQ32_01155 [Rickettsiales bacterium]|nr:hypothetical protein [Rickettsiales bacterium]